ncbi:hypothetical protein [Rhodococcus qingshengii]|uniref:hypothetical protein n=1 Tax=Rhodococcus qingshengii TaxID=334542 RepID=UPI001C5E2098|nr:hypothetical protein [Rhodococcus qingshengii]MBW4813455.1 hypothetical protein [Rhodococcus qingshengii]
MGGKWSEDSMRDQIRKAFDCAAQPVARQEAEAFWESRPILTHIRDYARACGRSPWGVLGVVLIRISAVIPPWVVLPDLTGNYGSLNLFVTLTGRSGSGKSATIEAGRMCVRIRQQIVVKPLGSGEGICKQYATRDSKTGNLIGVRNSVLFSVDEVNQVRALLSRSGSTLLSQMLTLFTAGLLGFSNADEQKSIALMPHRYRAGLLMGAQPANADVLMQHSGSGLPQRFLWFPVREAGRKRDRTLIKPSQITWDEVDVELALGDNGIEVLRSHNFEYEYDEDEFVVLRIPEEVEEIILDADDSEDEELDGHALFMREKVAAVLMWLDGRRTEVTTEDWELAGDVMAMSDSTRTAMQEQYNEAQARDNRSRSKAKGTGEAVSDIAKEDALLLAATTRLRDVIADLTDGGMRGSILRKKLTGQRAEYFDVAIEQLVDEGAVIRKPVEYRGQKGFKYYRPDV